MKSIYCPGGAMLAVGGAVQVTLEPDAAEQLRTTLLASKCTPCVGAKGRIRTTRSIELTLEKAMPKLAL